MPLTEPQIARYERQILLPEVGGRGQESLLATSVRVHGVGEAADEVATYLIAGGIGRVFVEPSFPAARLRVLESMNADVIVGIEGRADVEVECGDSNDRFVGAQLALQAMLQCIGFSESTEWTEETGTWWLP